MRQSIYSPARSRPTSVRGRKKKSSASQPAQPDLGKTLLALFAVHAMLDGVNGVASDCVFEAIHEVGQMMGGGQC